MTNLVLDDNFQRTHRPFAAKDIRPLQAGRVLMYFGANLLIVDKGKMSFLTEGLPDGKARMSFSANALTLCHLEEPFGTRY